MLELEELWGLGNLCVQVWGPLQVGQGVHGGRQANAVKGGVLLHAQAPRAASSMRSRGGLVGKLGAGRACAPALQIVRRLPEKMNMRNPVP